MPDPSPSILPLLFAAASALAFGGAAVLVGLRPGVIVDRPRLVLAVILGATLAGAAAILRFDPPGVRLEIDPSTEPLLPVGDPAQALYRQSIRDFGEDEVFVIAMETDDVFTHQSLERLRSVNDRIALLPAVRKVQSLVDVISFRYVPDEDWIEVARFIDELPEDPAELTALRARALANPLYRETLVSEDGRTAAINVTFREMSDREFIASRIDDEIARIVAEESAPGARFHVAGRPHVKARVYDVMLRDLGVLIPVAIAVIAAGLWGALGSRRGVVLPLATVLVAVVWTLGAMALLGCPLTILTVLLVPTLLTIGSVYGVHAVSFYEEIAPSAPDRRSAALEGLVQMRTPILISGLTTVIGFAALLVTRVPAVFQLGAFAVFGVAATTAVTLTGLHAALALLPLRAGVQSGPSRWLDAFLAERLARVSRSVSRHATAWLVFWGIVTVAGAAAIPRIVIDTDYLSFFDEDSEVRQDFEAVNRLLAGAVPLYVAIDGHADGALREPELLRSIERIQTRVEAIPGVSRTLSLADTVRVMNRALMKDDPAEERIPDERGSVAELVFLTPKGHLDLYTNANHSRGNVLVRTGAVGTAAVERVTGAIDEVLRSEPLANGGTAGVTGNALLLARSADGIASGQPTSVGLAVGTILVLVAFGLRSVRTGLVAMAPNVVPVVVFFGALGAGVAPLSLPTSLIASVALGITIDDTVHFLVRYREERRQGATPAFALEHCARTVGRPIVTTGTILASGFLVIGLSDFASLREFGFLSAGTMVVCLASDLTLLPALLTRTRA